MHLGFRHLCDPVSEVVRHRVRCFLNTDCISSRMRSADNARSSNLVANVSIWESCVACVGDATHGANSGAKAFLELAGLWWLSGQNHLARGVVGDKANASQHSRAGLAEAASCLALVCRSAASEARNAAHDTVHAIT